MSAPERFFYGVVACLCAALIYLYVLGVAIFSIEGTCLAHGYKDANVTVGFHRYCTKRVRGTDVVTPFDSVSGSGQ